MTVGSSVSIYVFNLILSCRSFAVSFDLLRHDCGFQIEVAPSWSIVLFTKIRIQLVNMKIYLANLKAKRVS